MGFMDTKHSKAVLEEARGSYHTKSIGAWYQVDTWNTHIFVLYEDTDEDGYGDSSGKYGVSMFRADNRSKGLRATLDDMERAVTDGAWDEGSYHELGEAVAAVKGDFGEITFEPGDPHKLKEALEAYEAEEKESWAW